MTTPQVKDLVWELHPLYGNLSIKQRVAARLQGNSMDCRRAVVHFNNGYELNVITGEYFYSDKINPYEAYVVVGKNLPQDKKPYGYLSPKSLQQLINNIARRKPLCEVKNTKAR